MEKGAGAGTACRRHGRLETPGTSCPRPATKCGAGHSCSVSELRVHLRSKASEGWRTPRRWRALRYAREREASWSAVVLYRFWPQAKGDGNPETPHPQARHLGGSPLSPCIVPLLFLYCSSIVPLFLAFYPRFGLGRTAAASPSWRRDLTGQPGRLVKVHCIFRRLFRAWYAGRDAVESPSI